MNVVGVFDWVPPFGTNTWNPRKRPLQLTASEDEIAQIGKGAGHWAPGTMDFDAVANKPPHGIKICPTFGHFLGAIVEQKSKSIVRIVVISHGDKGLFSFGGRIIERASKQGVEVRLNINTSEDPLRALDGEILARLAQGETFLLPGHSTPSSLADVRDRFAEDAGVYFFNCKSGADPRLLQEFANAFDVEAIGFKSKIAYCPRTTRRPPSINRRRIGLKKCGDFITSDYNALYGFARSINDIVVAIPEQRKKLPMRHVDFRKL